MVYFYWLCMRWMRLDKTAKTATNDGTVDSVWLLPMVTMLR